MKTYHRYDTDDKTVVVNETGQYLLIIEEQTRVSAIQYVTENTSTLSAYQLLIKLFILKGIIFIFL